MATTLTALATDGTRVVLGHLGDSRGYLFRDGALQQITTDHTYVQQMIAAGQLVPEQAPEPPLAQRRDALAARRAGRGRPGARTSWRSTSVPGDRVLLCSDGLTDLVVDERIAEILQLADPEPRPRRLVDAALEAGGTDNVTCLVFDVVDGPRVNGDGQLLGAVRDVVNIVDPGAVRAS